MMNVKLYTDGACSGNPGPGGWAAILVYKGAEKVLSGFEDATTNNRMELLAPIKGMEALKNPCEVEIISDSQYLVKSMNEGWVAKWQSNNWKKSNNEQALNIDLWERILELCKIHKVTFTWVEGHAQNEYNNRCDKLAVEEYTKNKKQPAVEKKQEKKMIYADNAATSRVKKEVVTAMLPYFETEFANPSSMYPFAYNAKNAMETARAQIADLIGATPQEIYFTSGGTESDNLAIKCCPMKGKKHIITSKIEHHAVSHTLEYLEKFGFEVTYLDVDSDGMVLIPQLISEIRPDTGLITIMYANNEIGTIEPIREIGEIARRNGILFHTDAVQAVGHIPVDVVRDNIDMLSLSGHKFGAQKGIGAIYIKKGIRPSPLLHGGGQERGLRSGTENIPAIVGMGVAAEIARRDMAKNMEHLTKMRERLFEKLSVIPYLRITGSRTERLPSIVSICIEACEGEALLLNMAQKGICVSSGSACTSGSLDPSHVLLAIGLPHHIAHGSMRISFDESVTEQEIDYISESIIEIADRIRNMSPVWENGAPRWTNTVEN